MEIITSPQVLREFRETLRQQGRKAGFVPTMGALHRGHAALVAASQREKLATISSIYVNPRQFGPNEDYARYPRAIESDKALLQAAGVVALYLPDDNAIYPQGYATKISVSGVTEFLCGPFRPGHFDGVATVVAKLFNQVMPDIAFFGEKDWQQLQLIKKLVTDLDMPVAVAGVPIVREEDGLALSSRNRYLSDEDRARAALLPRQMQGVAAALGKEGANINHLLDTARLALVEGGFQLDYLELANEKDCRPSQDRSQPLRLFAAARLGATRLIDNWSVKSG
jgi:pantoate--beta-alanine ligase